MLHIGDWKNASGLYKHMVLYPPQILGGTLPECIMPVFEEDFYVPLAYQAYRLNVTFNSGYFARVNDNKARKYCQKLHNKFKKDSLLMTPLMSCTVTTVIWSIHTFPKSCVAG